MTDHQPGEDAEALAEENARLRADLEAAEAKTSEARKVRAGKIRRTLVVILVILTSLSVVASTVGVWINRTVWNQDRYLALVTPLARDTAVTDALATKVTDQVFEALNLQERVGEVLANFPKVPSQAQFLVGPIESAMHDFVLGQVKSFLRSDAFYNLWVQLNTQLHPKLVALLQGDYSQLPNLSVSGGAVQLNLIPVVYQIIQQVVPSLGINATLPDLPSNATVASAISLVSSHLGVSLPPDFGQLTIMTQDQLQSYQQAAQSLRRLGYGLILLTLVLAGVTIAVSKHPAAHPRVARPGRRRGAAGGRRRDPRDRGAGGQQPVGQLPGRGARHLRARDLGTASRGAARGGARPDRGDRRAPAGTSVLVRVAEGQGARAALGGVRPERARGLRGPPRRPRAAGRHRAGRDRVPRRGA